MACDLSKEIDRSLEQVSCKVIKNLRKSARSAGNNSKGILPQIAQMGADSVRLRHLLRIGRNNKLLNNWDEITSVMIQIHA